jgi:hypothetical protein
MLCHCCRRSYNSSLQILLNFEHNDPWHRIKVTMDLGYCSHTHFQTRGPKVQKLMFLLFVHNSQDLYQYMWTTGSFQANHSRSQYFYQRSSQPYLVSIGLADL